MATEPQKPQKLPEECPVCSTNFKDPKVLPCFHIMCRNCIIGLKVRDRDEIRCPVNRCGRTFSCEGNDPELLPDAVCVYHSQDLSKLKRSLEQDEIKCYLCLSEKHTEVSAVASCNQCTYVCKDCLQLHSTGKKEDYSDHEIVTFMELSDQHDDSLHDKVLIRSRSTSFIQRERLRACKTHSGEKKDSYCLDCLQFVCPKCIDSEHSSGSHHVKFISRAIEKCHKIVGENISEIQVAHRRVSCAVHDVRNTTLTVEDQHKALSSSIDATFDRLVKFLEQKKKILHTSLNQFSVSKVQKLHEQRAELEQLASELERMATFTDNCLSTSTEREFLTNYKFLHDSISERLEKTTEQSLLPVETANMAFKNSSARKQIADLCHKNLMIYLQQANPSTCTAQGDGLRSAETMKFASFTVNVVNRNRKVCSSIQDVAVKVKCVENDFETQAIVTDSATGKYNVSYCPEFRGEHCISVSVNDRYITGSPFTVQVYKPPSQLGKAQGVIADVTGPRGIAIKKTGTLLVCEWNGNRIVEMDKLGRRIRSIGGVDLQHPTSVDLDRDGNLYLVIGAGDRMGLAKYAGDGKLLRAVRRGGSGNCEFNTPRGVRVNHCRNEVCVCDRDNNRIQVFGTEKLDYLRSIKLRGIDESLKNHSRPNDIVFDKEGNIYITDYSNDCILCLDSKEKYLRKFSEVKQGEDSNSHSSLGGPECLCIDKHGFLYVTESKVHRVSVFKTNGECLTAFGKFGLREGELKFPMGIITDENGSVYVCELFNNRIQVF